MKTKTIALGFGPLLAVTAMTASAQDDRYVPVIVKEWGDLIDDAINDNVDGDPPPSGAQEPAGQTAAQEREAEPDRAPMWEAAQSHLMQEWVRVQERESEEATRRLADQEPERAAQEARELEKENQDRGPF